MPELKLELVALQNDFGLLGPARLHLACLQLCVKPTSAHSFMIP